MAKRGHGHVVVLVTTMMVVGSVTLVWPEAPVVPGCTLFAPQIVEAPPPPTQMQTAAARDMPLSHASAVRVSVNQVAGTSRPSRAPVTDARVRVFGSRAGHRLLIEVLRVRGESADLPSIEFVRGERALCDFDIAIALADASHPSGHDSGLRAHYLGDFVPVLLPARARWTEHGFSTLYPHQWRPLLERCMPEVLNTPGRVFERERSVEAVCESWRARSDVGAIVNLNTYRTLGGDRLGGPLSPGSVEFRDGESRYGVRVYLLVGFEPSEGAKRLLRFVLDGPGRKRVAELLSCARGPSHVSAVA